MRRIFRNRKDNIVLDRMFETRSDAWAAAGLEGELNRHAVRHAARRLMFELVALLAVIIGKSVAHSHTDSSWTTPITVVAVILVLAIGWLSSRDLPKAAPALFRRMDPATAGTVEFAIRLFGVAATVLIALAVGGVGPGALAVGGAFTAVVLGLAAQQTLGNLFAGMVLLIARPFRLGERVRLQAGVLAGTQEGVVASLGLLYTTLSRGDERVMIPNNIVLSASVLPIREPKPVDVKVTLGAGVGLMHIQSVLDANISVPTRSAASVLLEEINGNCLVVRVRATPERDSQGAQLADEIIAALITVTGEHSAVVDGGARRD